MAECLRSKKVKIRKDRNCFGCFKKLDKGTENILSETCVEDSIYTIYFCESCQEWLENKCQKCGECYELENATMGFIRECEREMNNNEFI